MLRTLFGDSTMTSVVKRLSSEVDVGSTGSNGRIP